MKSFRFLLITLSLLFCWNLSNAQDQLIGQLYDRLESDLLPHDRANTMARLGMIYTQRSLDSSFHYGNAALELARSIKDGESEARALNVLAFYYMQKGKNYLAYKYANAALAGFERLRLAEQVVEMKMNIGVLLLEEGKVAQGIEQIEVAYQESFNLERDSIRALIMINMVMPQAPTMPAAEMGKFLEEAQRIADEHHDERTQMILRHAKVLLLFRSGAQIDYVRTEMRRLRSELQDRGYRYIEALSLLDLAHTFSTQSADSVQYYIGSALDLADSLGYDQLRYVILNHADRIWQGLQPVPPNPSLYSAQIWEINRIRALENDRDGLGFLELTIRENDLSIQQARLELRQTWAAVMVIAGTLAILIAVWAFSQYRVKRRLLRNLELASRELEKKNQLLEAKDQFSTRLIAVLSHDLRQPFSSILMMSNDLMAELDPKEQERVYQEIQHSASLSLQVLDGLLYWIKLQTVGWAETPVSVSIQESLEDAVDFYAYNIERSAIQIDWKIDEELAVSAQPEMLLFVNRNLINNAIKYSPVGGMIQIQAYKTEDNEHVHVQISDGGPGIPEAVLKQLFIKSPSISSENGKEVKGGAGLALIICKEMITELNGKIWAGNRPDGSGAVFSYELPVSQWKAVSVQKVAESH
ncbi:MAG TPA: HAMP domain-containing sensor histidine kinase [Sphingobacteriaceae bacterium]|nr:HAMP domain-containing sensor histidine kinase [Sphingobacteriaceae bacterium]